MKTIFIHYLIDTNHIESLDLIDLIKSIFQRNGYKICGYDFNSYGEYLNAVKECVVFLMFTTEKTVDLPEFKSEIVNAFKLGKPVMTILVDVSLLQGSRFKDDLFGTKVMKFHLLNKGIDIEFDDSMRALFEEIENIRSKTWVFDLNEMCLNDENVFDMASLNTQAYPDAIELNFSGLESATDYLFYLLSKKLASHPRLNSSSQVILKGCKNITIWSLHYISKAFQESECKEKYDFIRFLKLHKALSSISGCDQINDSLVASLMQDDQSKLRSLFTTSKTVIINEDSQPLFLIDILIDKQNTSETDNQSKNIFKFSQIKISNKKVNIFECLEVSVF